MADPHLMFWGPSWAWGLPVIVLTVVLHVSGLRAIRRAIESAPSNSLRSRMPGVARTVIPGVVVLLVTCLHALEAAMWAEVYVIIGVLPGRRWAMIYSLGTMTAFGGSGYELTPGWRMLGPIEALNGLILFGLTTAFLFGVIERAWQTPEE
ncbi:hypothetical protein [Phenylobacterium sp.]|jgi:hypothetical protein|uniref:hypothetical protein n=1 Tax=Phenylobacterium sp. TaxID=1871053 RepID=UPI002E336F8D|nr:hypothetical protein [Phenylobacterium sp.]HEX4710407.1 hypothetical protein [Phenylobacterium sp.]